MQLHLDTSILKLKPFVSKERERISLCHILFEDGNAVACNGHVMVIMKLNENQIKAEMKEQLLIPVDFLETCFRLSTQTEGKPKRKVIDIASSNNALECTVRTPTAKISLLADKCTYPYPNYKSVIRDLKNKEPEYKQGLNSFYVESIFKLLPAAYATGWHFSFYGETKPTLFTRVGVDIYGIIMPLRLSE